MPSTRVLVPQVFCTPTCKTYPTSGGNYTFSTTLYYSWGFFICKAVFEGKWKLGCHPPRCNLAPRYFLCWLSPTSCTHSRG